MTEHDRDCPLGQIISHVVMEIADGMMDGMMGVGELTDEQVAEGNRIAGEIVKEQLPLVANLIMAERFATLPTRFQQITCTYMGLAMVNYDLIRELIDNLAKGESPSRRAMRGVVSDLIRKTAKALEAGASIVQGLANGADAKSVFKEGVDFDRGLMLTGVTLEQMGDTQESVGDSFLRAHELSVRESKRDRFRIMAMDALREQGIDPTPVMERCAEIVGNVDHDHLAADVATATDMLKAGKFDDHLTEAERAVARSLNV